MKTKNRFLHILSYLCLSVGIFFSCQPQDQQSQFHAPLLDGLDAHALKISTQSEMAQRFFNQGLMLAYGFNHDEAARSFREAARQDTSCAMCYWGVAYALGPNINAAMEDANVDEAYFSAQKALSLSGNASDWEQAMIEAMADRYGKEKGVDRSALDQAFADGMAKAYEAFPDHADIAAIYAEALMDLHPWDLWNKDGSPKSWTPKIVEVLEVQLKKWPKHPSANHFYIHAVEASFDPDRANASADLLMDLVPGAGHLLHMPSHTFIRSGQYHKGSIANENAIKADSMYVAGCHIAGVYPLTYYPHNYHFLAATATLEGRGEVAIEAGYQVASHANMELMKEPGWGTLQHFYTIPYNMLVKFGQWDQILALPAPSEDLHYPRAIWYYARGMAFTAKGDIDRAYDEWLLLQEEGRHSSVKEITVWDINTVSDLVEIATLVLEAEMAVKKGDFAHAISQFEAAVEKEDQLNYNEPPDWFFSVRHHLGAALIEAERFAEAEAVYQKDLEWLPKNGWALKGLQLALEGQKRIAEADEIEKQFVEAWQWADIQLESSRVNDIAVKQYPYSPQELMANSRYAVGRTGVISCGK